MVANATIERTRTQPQRDAAQRMEGGKRGNATNSRLSEAGVDVIDRSLSADSATTVKSARQAAGE